MPDLLTPLSDICQTQLEASRRIADAVFSGTGKIDRIFRDAAKRSVEEQLRFAQAVGTTRDLHVLTNLQATFWSGKPEQIRSLQQEFMRILAEMQNEVGRATQAFIEQFGANSLRAGPTAMGIAAPAMSASTAVRNPFAPMMSAWEAALQSVSQLSGTAMASMRNASRAAAAVGAVVSPAMREGAGSATLRLEPQQRSGNGNGNGNGHGNGNGNGNGHGNGHGNGNGHVQDTAVFRGAGDQRRLEPESDAGPQAVRAHDEPEDPTESGNGAGGTGRKSAQNRRK